MGQLGPLIAQVRRLWGRLGRAQQMGVIGVAGGALVFAFIFLSMGGQQTYVTAFTNLDPKDSSAVAEQLRADGIPFQATPDGGTIKVPPDKLADARLKLAAKGLPAGGAVGFELFDKTSFGVTDFVQHINYQRALEGELARTIGTLAQVEGARVHIVVPKQELFTAQQKPATASVVLRLRPGRTIDENGLRGISHMIARSVEGLEEKNITILDAAGRQLFDGNALAGAGIGLSATQLEAQQKLEKGLEGELQSLLDRVAGANRSVVRVRAELDFAQQEELNETFTPGGPNNQGVPRSSSTVQESFNGAPGQNAGQPGAAANLPGARAAAAGGANSNSAYQRSETTTNFEVSKSTKRTVTSGGQVKRLSVSVLLDSSIPEGDAAGLRDAVAAAAGIDAKRGDQIVVTTAAFGGAQSGEAVMAKAPLTALIGHYAKLAIPVLAALVVLFFIWRMARGVSPPKLKAVALGAQPALAAATASGPAISAADAAAAYAVNSGEQYPQLTAGNVAEEYIDLDTGRRLEPAEAKKRKEIADRMQHLARTNPDAVAEIVHSWMTSDEKGK